MSDRPSEVTEMHTRLLRVTLEPEACATYWSHADPSLSRADVAKRAFDEGWFGERSEARVHKLVDEFASRFDPFPDALNVLRGWSDMPLATCRLIAHWHIQLTDVFYRRFSGEFLPELHGAETPSLTREMVAAWVERIAPERWADSTKLKYAGNLITTAAEAGLLSQPMPRRTALLPDVPNDALAYLLHLLLDIGFDGSMTNNPYLRSVGLHGDRLERALVGLAGRPHAVGIDFSWMCGSLAKWAASRTSAP